MPEVAPLDGASAFASVIREHLAARMDNRPPSIEAATINADYSLQPDSWTHEPWPGPPWLLGPGSGSWEAVARLQPGFSEPAEATASTHSHSDPQGGSTGVASHDHRHPNREVQPGDRVVIVWMLTAQGETPLVLEVL